MDTSQYRRLSDPSSCSMTSRLRTLRLRSIPSANYLCVKVEAQTAPTLARGRRPGLHPNFRLKPSLSLSPPLPGTLWTVLPSILSRILVFSARSVLLCFHMSCFPPAPITIALISEPITIRGQARDQVFQISFTVHSFTSEQATTPRFGSSR